MRIALVITGVATAAALLIAVFSLRPTAAPAAVSASAPSAKVPAPPISVQVATVGLEAFEVSVPATGALRARESVELVSELSRRLVKVRAVEGASVKKGAVLFELDVADVQAEISRLEVQIRLAETTLKRQKSLSAEGLSTEAELDTAQAKLDELYAERRVRGVTLSKSQIRAPFAGVIGLRHVSEGAWVSPSTPLATLHDTRALKLDFTLPERYASLLQNGQGFRFTVEGRSEKETATVRAFEPAIDPGSRSVVVRGEVDNLNGLLPGAFARVELPLRVEQAVLLPAIAVVPGADGRRVFVERDGVARSVSLEVGARTADRVQALSGVSAGDRVIITNLLRLKDGARVRVVPAEAAK